MLHGDESIFIANLLKRDLLFGSVRFMKSHFLIALTGLFISLKSYALSMNDLSILIPLPNVSELSLMLSPGDLGNKGSLLQKSTYNKFFNLVADKSKEEIWSNQLKVVAIRFDPCFIEGEGPLACRRQIRLVWQPVYPENNLLTTRDASMHSFYEFSDLEYTQVLSEWKKWATLEQDSPLQIHPLLEKEGLAGKHFRQLRSMILNFCGTQNLVRMTSMNVMGNAQLWIFSGFDIYSNGTSKEIIIPRIKEISQAITQSSFDPNEFWGALTPAPSEDLAFNLLIDDSMFFRKMQPHTEVKKAIRSLLSFENPQIKNTGNLDCASCHLANMAHQWTETNYPNINWDLEFSHVNYKSTFNLENVTKHKVNPNQFRIFGYFGNEPAISQRVINETAAVLELMKRTYKIK